jgi:KDO transferase-3
MRKLHPDFRLRAWNGKDGYDIFWKGRKVGATKPFHALTRPHSSSCFIVASGRSIAHIDLSALSRKVCFSVNGSIVKFEEHGLRYTYYVVTDKNFARDRFDLVRRGILSGADCLFGFRVLNEIAEREPSLLRADNLFLLQDINARYDEDRLSPSDFDRWVETQPDLVLHDTRRLARGRVGFSKRIERGVFSGQTVVFSALQVAYAQGYRLMFILGMDLGGDGTLARFYESTDKALISRLDRDFEPYIVPSFDLARRVCETEDRQIFNLSLNSRLPETILPKLGFDDALLLSEQFL